jgi:hypothetical protein
MERCLVSRVFEVLSAVESGINGPHSRSDHRHGSSKDNHYDCRQRVRRADREEYPDPNDSNHGSGYWRPKAEKQKYCRDRRHQERHSCRQAGDFKKVRDPIKEDDRARQYALQQKTGARPPFGKAGKKTLQTCSPMLMLLAFGRTAKGLKGGFSSPTSGALQAR